MTRSKGRPRTRPDTVSTANLRKSNLAYYYREGIKSWARTALNNARQRAKQKGLEFRLTLDDVLKAAEGVTTCPILGVTLSYERGGGIIRPHSASIDRIDNKADYAPDTIAIISTRANMLKSNCTLQDLIALGKYAEQHLE